VRRIFGGSDGVHSHVEGTQSSGGDVMYACPIKDVVESNIALSSVPAEEQQR
jgi:hypothetical protein